MDFDKLLVATKFAPPRIGARYIVRKQLLEALHRGRDSKLTLVPGSAGFGKTILLAQWRQELMKEGLQVAWLSLSPDERLLPNFSAHLFAALARLGLPTRHELPLVGDRSQSMEAAIARAVNHLSAIDEDLYLIIDDYHHVEDPAAHSLLQKLVELSPGNLHIALASRALPPLSIARVRVMGQVAEIDCGDLPFDRAETGAFLEQSMGAVSAEETSQVQDLTQGWPACVQLVSIILKSRPERRAAMLELAWQSSDLQSYLSEDVVARLPSDISEFMESVSICRRFNAELAATVTGNAQAGALLRRIEEENLLIMRVESDDRSPWFRFHPLFADFLMQRLQQRAPETVHELHRRASAWCAEKGLVVEAVRHARLGGDFDQAVAIFDRAAPATWRLSHFAPMLHLLNTLPPETIANHPRLLLLASLTTAFTGRPARAEVLAEQLKAATGSGAGFPIALADAAIAFQRDDSARSLDLLQGFEPRHARTSFERHIYLSTLGFSLAATGRYAEAHQLIENNPPPLEERNDDLAIVTEGCRTAWRLMEGRAAEAERIGSATLARAIAVHGRHSLCANLCTVSVAGALLELDQVDKARELLASQLHQLSTYPPDTMITAALCKAQLDLLRDPPEEVLARLDDLVAMFRSLGLDRGVAHMLAEQASIHLAVGDRARAAEAVERLEAIAARNAEATGFRAEIPAVAALAKARLLEGTGADDAVLDALATARTVSERLGRGRLLLQAELIAARVMAAAGRPEESSAHLAAAVERAAPLGLVRTFVAEGADLHSRLVQLRTDERLTPAADAWLESLLARFNVAPPADAALKTKEKPLLTPREVEILDLVATGMSNKRIALTLGITLETVKWNLKNVFLKLEVPSRYDAMIWARRQGLIT